MAETSDLGELSEISTPQKVNSPDFSEVGNTGLKCTGGWIYEEFLPALRWPKAGAIYQEMSFNDPVITAILLCSRQLIRNVKWTVVPASKDAVDIEVANFITECMDDMSSTWADFIDDLTSCFEYGWSYHEVVYKKRLGKNTKPNTANSKFNDGRIGWRKMPGRSQTTLMKWEMDEQGGIQGLWQYTDKGTVFIPIGRSLLFRTTANRGNPEGRSFLRGAYRPWYFKKHIEEIEGIGIERDLAGLPVVTAPPGVNLYDTKNKEAVEAKNNALALVSSIRRDRNEGVVLPDGWKLELLSSASNRQFDTNAIINRYDQRIAITMLADIVMLGADKVGSFALAKVKQSMLAAALNAQLTNVCEVINDYAIPRLIDLNIFPGRIAYPTISVGSVVSPDLTELGNYIKALTGINMPLLPDINVENYLRRVANLPEVEEDVQRKENIAESRKASQTKKPTGTENDSTQGDTVKEGEKTDA